jgi:CheY-like chemotaxis protein
MHDAEQDEARIDEPVTILLVEDNPDHAELVRRGLEGHPIANQIVHVSDGEAALNYLFQRGVYADASTAPRPQLILLDLRLPRIDGLAVLKQIRADEHIGKTPVVILTTSNAERDVARAYEMRANSYIIKPLDFSKYMKLMADLSIYWLSWNHYPWAG